MDGTLIAFFVGINVLATAATVDALFTERGIEAGVGVEGNPIIVGIFGNKPKLWQLLLFNFSYIFGLGAIVARWPSVTSEAFMATLSVPAALLHVREAYLWHRLLHGEGLPKATNILTKFLWGFASGVN
jgi:hypothetical protein